MDDVIRAAGTGAAAAAAAAASVWAEYELAVAARQSWGPGDGVWGMPCEGADGAETQFLVTHVVQDGVREVLPLPDGPVAGRWELGVLCERARGARGAEKELCVCVCEAEAAAVRWELARFSVGDGADSDGDLSDTWEETASGVGGEETASDVRAGGRGADEGGEGAGERSSGGGADVAWPLVRRCAKLSWALAVVFSDADAPVVRQAVLETASIVERLKIGLAWVLHQQHALSAQAALKGLTMPVDGGSDSSGGSDSGGGSGSG
ncbi:hypothetical protein FOA52_007486 [Chlamydomonas sp. UWO 241]|nr:hypothetical protein FOA52_007486 [Chlamydomonas sp. UWO 241]